MNAALSRWQDGQGRPSQRLKAYGSLAAARCWLDRGCGGKDLLPATGSPRILGFSAYVYALDRLPVSIVSLHPYVNPVVAVWLGWLVCREPFGAREAAAMVIIFRGVGLVKRQVGKRL